MTTLSEEFSNLEPCAESINWISHGKNRQRSFYMLRGEQIVMNTSGYIETHPNLMVRAIRYAFGGDITVCFWLQDRVMKINENTALLAKYGGKVDEGPVYSDFLNVGVPFFSTEEGMLAYIEANPFSEFVRMRNEEIYEPKEEAEQVDKLFDTFFFGTQSIA